MDALNFTTGRQPRAKLSPASLSAIMLTVFISATGIILISRHAHGIIGIWVANAILAAVLMRHRRSDWKWIVAAGFIANALATLFAYQAVNALIVAVVSTVEILLVVLPLRQWDMDRNFNRPSALLAFYTLAIVAPLFSAGPLAMIGHSVHQIPFLPTAIGTFGANALGYIIVVPPLLTVKWDGFKSMFRNEQIVLTTALLGALVATIAFNYYARSYPFAFLFFPIVVLLTFQRGLAGGTLGVFLTGLYMIVPAVVGQSSGALHAHPIREQVIIVQVFIAVMDFTVILIGAALEERQRLEQGLANAIARAENSREEAIVAKESAEKANRTKSMFLATMSHELRTPLNAVIGFAEMMNSQLFGPLGDPRYHEYTGVIQSAGRHLLDLINDVLDMSKIEAGKHEIQRETLNVAEIVQDGMTLMAENASSGGVDLTADLPSCALTISADKRAMKQILLNLLSNAIKFTPFGGDVTAKAELRDGRVILSVRDTGVGIPQDQIYRLGNPFVQIRNSAGTSQNGTGLGLALVRSLTEMQDGTLKIESEEGRGTLVSVSFPAFEPASLAA